MLDFTKALHVIALMLLRIQHFEGLKHIPRRSAHIIVPWYQRRLLTADH